ncbi:hypothetical protein SOCE26_087780 [Sorangium cellulosum]|uniref:Secreted protein n=1 Tax=Sorangium cellulosum TaxID=56 RepID=A0A2L0F6S4_SORCE|nr:hypothetical protein [Sorangium cellulosum]AUX47260.1 hypothetical protein SOCE26_087780 [Sorangium cellulosum]
MRTARALVGRGLAAGAVALACAATARAEEPTDTGAQTDVRAENAGAQDASAPRDDAAAAGAPSRPPRPPLPPAPPRTRLPWGRHIEVGGDLALVSRTVATETDGEPTRVHYRPALGLGVHARWEIMRFLRFSAFLVHAEHELALAPGALGLPGVLTGDRGDGEAPSVRTIALGGRLAPTLSLSERARSWLSIGIGYDRFDFERMTVLDPGKGAFTVRERGASFVEVPIGVGMSFDLIRNWLTIELESSGAFLLGRGGDATRLGQAIDVQGQRRSVGPLPRPQGSFIHTLGLSIVL